MAPEQVKGLRTIDARADIWSLGVVLYRTLAGRTPHDDCETTGQLLLAICTRRPRHLQDAAPWIEPAVAELVHRALQINPKRRFESAEAMHEACSQLLADGSKIEASMLRCLSDDERAVHGPRVELDRGDPRETLGADTLPPRPGKRRALGYVAVAAGVALLGLAAARGNAAVDAVPAPDVSVIVMGSAGAPHAASPPSAEPTHAPSNAQPTPVRRPAASAVSTAPTPDPAPSSTPSAPVPKKLDVSRTLE
jgi:serine/threonine-protein kinase